MLTEKSQDVTLKDIFHISLWSYLIQKLSHYAAKPVKCLYKLDVFLELILKINIIKTLVSICLTLCDL